jgi:hypothetical protein
MPVTINLQPSTTYSLTLANATQENAAATGDLDINTSNHTVTIVGGGSAGPSASVIDAAALNVGAARDRVFQITVSGVFFFQDLVIQNGSAADDGASGASTNPAAQNANRAGGGILNNGGRVTLTNVNVRSCRALGKGDDIVNEHRTLDAHGGGLASLGGGGYVVITGSTLSDDLALGGDGGNSGTGGMMAGDCKSVKLRAERVGGGNGRVYTITFEVSDASGNVGTATTTVTVPHSQNGSAAVDDGPHYTVLGSCP